MNKKNLKRDLKNSKKLKSCMYMYTYWFDNSPIRLSYWTRSASRSRAFSLRSFSIIAICSKWHFSCSFNWFSNAKISSLALSTVRRIDANREGSCCEINYVCNIAVVCTTVASIYWCKKSSKPFGHFAEMKDVSAKKLPKWGFQSNQVTKMLDHIF